MTDSVDKVNGCPNFGHSKTHETLSTQKGLVEQKKLSVREAAEVMSIGVTTLRRIISRGEIPVLRIDGKTLLLTVDVEAYLQGRYGCVEAVETPSAPVGVPDIVLSSDILKVS